jgi:hypothetical protein
VKRRFFTGVAVLAVLAGGTTAVVTAAQPARDSRPAHAGPLVAAANYLGVTKAQLQSELRSGRSLAQVAGATPGRSEAGLIEALVAAGRARLAAASANLTTKVTALVNRLRGPHATPPALSYLGIGRAQLQRELRAGKTLAQIADGTPGRSAAGLVEALVTVRKARLAALVAAGRLGQAQEARRLEHLTSRVTAEVNRAHPLRRGG